MSNIFFRIINKLQRKFEKPKRYYNIDGFDMDLGEGHMLSLSQKYNPMYDRFVPYLAKIIANGL